MSYHYPHFTARLWRYSTPKWNQCFWKKYNVAWPFQGEPGSNHAMPTAALGSSTSNTTVFGTVQNTFRKYVASIAVTYPLLWELMLLRIETCGMWRSIDVWMVPDVLKESSWCLHLQGQAVQELLHLQRWRDCILLKHWQLHNKQHRVTSQKTWIVFPLLICYTHFAMISWVLSHNLLLHLLQKAAFAKFPDLREFSLANVASVDTREALLKHFGPLRYGCRTVGCLQWCHIGL